MSDINLAPDYTTWLQEIEATIAKQKAEHKEPHLILYTDGGCQPTPRGQGGCGIHGYIYTRNKPKQGQGCKGFGPTDRGYVNGETGDRVVSVVGYIDVVSSIIPSSTNNEAELVALYQALQVAQGLKVHSLHLILDSRYVLDGLTSELEKWVGAGWRKSDGQPPANLERWRAIRDLLQVVTEQCPVSWEWTKGHSDDVGNHLADINATCGVYAGNKGHDHYAYRFSSPKKYWAPEANYNRFFCESRWYFNTRSSELASNGKYVYYLGNHGPDDDHHGKPVADTNYAVVMLSAPDPVLTEIREYQAQLVDDFGMVVIAQLNNILKPSVYTEALRSGSLYMRRAENKIDIYTSSKLQLTRLADPARLAYRAEEVQGRLEELLMQYDSDQLPPNHVLTEITPVIYEEVVVKEEPTLKVKLASGQEAAAVRVSVKHHGPDGPTTDITLTVGIDTPKRNYFSAVSSCMPKVYVLTWPEPCSATAFRYATVVETVTGECGIWAGAYANLRIVA